jgi:hypothetical protein
MMQRGAGVPVIGVAKSGYTLEMLRARARESIEKHVGLDAAAFEKLSGLLRYVDGDYSDAATYQAIRKELGAAQRPAHYLAIPPALFGTVVEQLAKADCTGGARIVVEKPFERPGVRSGAQPHPAEDIHRGRHLSHRPLSGQTAGAQHGVLPFRERAHGIVLEPPTRGERPDHHGGELRRPGPRFVL